MTSTEAETIAHLRERIAALEAEKREGFSAQIDDALSRRIAALEADKENLRVEWERLRDRELSLEAENERLRTRISAIVASAGHWTVATREHIYGSHADTGLCNCEIMVNRNAVEEARAALAGRKTTP